MQDWLTLIRDLRTTDLWGHVAVDFYFKEKSEEKAAEFIRWLVPQIFDKGMDIAAFHQVLLCVCIQLLGPDLKLIMELTSSVTELTSSDIPLTSLCNQYAIYGKDKEYRTMLEEKNGKKPSGFTGNPSKLPTSQSSVHHPAGARAIAPVAAAEFADPCDIPIANEILDTPFSKFPMLRWAGNRLTRQLGQPFAGLKCAFILHYLTDLVPFAQACLDLGIAPTDTIFFWKPDYKYPYRNAIRNWLTAKDFEARSLDHLHEYIESTEAFCKRDGTKVLIVEDGGYIVPELHKRNSPLLSSVIGAVEQTTKGLRKTEDLFASTTSSNPNCDGVIRFPLMSIPDSKVKKEIEPKHIADAVVRCVENIISVPLRGRTVSVLGLGTIGFQVFQCLKNHGSVVIGHDVNDTAISNYLYEGGRRVDTPEAAARQSDLVIGCSGRQTITASVIESLKHGAYVASASSDLVEVDMDYLEDRKQSKRRFGIKDAAVTPGELWGGTRYIFPGDTERTINLIADGLPVTFWGAPGMPHEGGDLIMTVILVAAAELAARNGTSSSNTGVSPYPIHICRDAVDELDSEYKLQAEFLRIYHP